MRDRILIAWKKALLPKQGGLMTTVATARTYCGDSSPQKVRSIGAWKILVAFGHWSPIS